MTLTTPSKLLAALSLTTALGIPAQTPAPTTTSDAPPVESQTSNISVRSSLVLVPALVKTKAGELVYTLKASDFLVTDHGIPQRLRLEEDTDREPLPLVILVQIGGSGGRRLEQYASIGTELEAMLGNIQRRIAVVSYDSAPTVVQPFNPRIERATDALVNLEPGDTHAATLDAIVFATNLLRQQPPQYRRAILLLSETHDQGSRVPLNDALRAIGDTNTTIYSVAFSSAKTGISQEASKFSSDEPGPAGGCFAHDPNTDESRATQNFDCLAQLLPPLRLARMAAIATVNGFRRNVAETVAQVTGGEFYSFKDSRSLKRDLLTISNHVPNRYVLSFHPQGPHAGFHAIQLKLRNYDNLIIQSRNGYWVDEDQSR